MGFYHPITVDELNLSQAILALVVELPTNIVPKMLIFLYVKVLSIRLITINDLHSLAEYCAKFKLNPVKTETSTFHLNS